MERIGNALLSVIIISVMVLGGAVTSILTNGDEAAASRSPQYKGELNADDTWSGEFFAENIKVPEGITLTIEAGTKVSMYRDNYFIVEGTLVLNGTVENPVIFDCVTPGRVHDKRDRSCYG